MQLTTGGTFVASPKIAATSDGDVVAAWTNGNDVRLQRLSAAGATLWGGGVTLADPGTADYLLSDLHGSDDGSVIVSFNRQQGFSGAKHIYAQRISAAGALLWGTGHVIVFDGSIDFALSPWWNVDELEP